MHCSGRVLRLTRCRIMSNNVLYTKMLRTHQSDSKSIIQVKNTTMTCEKSVLTDEQMLIYNLHLDACKNQKRTYIDPKTGCNVFTEFAHRKRGRCCGSACRHCPYGQINVQDPTKKKAFNSLFYV
ncbi:hypothetical protein DNTS_015836 [Danionella cerebrum]|uniref:Uncharacterized protein n=1 Tax=Danionella cerebrum TaxID=2873325 RepID=A0A553Q8L1_9TELE|nr:hypothetical protein DNTS_015836 [Danionella translucida]